MFLTIVGPAGHKENPVAINWERPLGELPMAKKFAGCLYNGQLREDWRAIVPRRGDRVNMIVPAGDPYSWAMLIVNLIINLAVSAITRALSPSPKKPSLNSKRHESFGIAGFNNTTGPGTPEWVPYGLNRIAGHVIGSGVDIAPDGRSMLGRVLYFAGDTGGDGVGGFSDFEIDNVGADQYEGLEVHTRLGYDNQAIIPGFENVEQLYGVSQPLPYDIATDTGTPIIYTTKSNTVEQIRLIFLFAGGLFRIDSDDGSRDNAKITFRIELKKNSDPVSAYAEVAGSPITYKDRINADLYKAFDIITGAKEKWDVRMTVTFKQHGNSVVANPALFNVQETEFTAENYPGKALYALTNIPAKQIQSLEAMRVTCLQQGKICKEFDSAGNTIFAATRKRAWILRDIMTHKRVGMGHEIEESEISAIQWKEDAQDYWDEAVDAQGGGTEPRDLCDVIINESRWDWEWVKAIAAEGRGRIFPSGDQWKLAVDKPGTPNLLYAEPGNIIEGTMVAEVAAEDNFFNQIIAEFRNVDDNYRPDIAQPITDPAIGSDPIVQEVRKYETLTRESQVLRENMIVLKRAKLERRRWSFTSPPGAIVSEPLDLDRLAERQLGGTGAYAGILPAGSTVSTVLLPSIVELLALETYYLVVKHNADNTIERRQVTTAAGKVGAVDVTPDLTAAPADGDIFALAIEDVEEIITRAQDFEIDDEGRVKQIRTEYVPAVYTPDPLPSKLERRYFKIQHVPPIPLRDAQVIEEIVKARDGSYRSVLSFSVTPGLERHSGQALGGFPAPNPHIILGDEPERDNYFRGAFVKIIDGTGAGQPEKRIILYTIFHGAYVDSDWSTVPDASSIYEIRWERFGDYAGFKIEVSDEATGEFAVLAEPRGVQYELDGRGQRGTRYYRFTPYSVEGKENVVARIVRSITLSGDTAAPSPPAVITHSAYLKDLTIETYLNRPVAEDLAGIELNIYVWWGFWQLWRTIRVGAPQDNLSFGQMLIKHTVTVHDQPYGTLVTADAKTIDYSNNMSASLTSGIATTLTDVQTGDITPNAVSTISEFVNNETVTCPVGQRTQIGSIIVTTQGGSVKLETKCLVTELSNTNTEINLEIRRGDTPGDPVLDYDQKDLLAQKKDSQIVFATDNVPAGTYTYSIWMHPRNSDVEVSRRRLFCFEVKR